MPYSNKAHQANSNQLTAWKKSRRGLVELVSVSININHVWLCDAFMDYLNITLYTVSIFQDLELKACTSCFAILELNKSSSNNLLPRDILS